MSGRQPIPAVRRSRFRRWIEERTGLDAILRVLLDESIPGGARWAYVFGSGLLFLFACQVVTGILLALFYVPAANDAHITVAYIVKVVSGGSFLRSLHSYGASALIVVLLAHTIQTFFYGAYKGKRELVWVAGCALLALTLGMAFTGYLLPWDQKAYFATAVGTNAMGEVPVAGNFLKRLLRGGNEMGTITLSRFYVLHVFLLPGLIVALIAAHVYLFRKAGPAGPVAEPLGQRKPPETFYPRQFGKDFAFAVLLASILAALAYILPVKLGPKASPADTTFLPRPEWYFLPIFEWLKFWPGKSAFIGVVVLPAVVTALFVGVPFLDRGATRRPLGRPLAIGGFAVVLAGMIGIGVFSRMQDRRDPLVAAEIARQERATEAFMQAPFSPLAPATASAQGATGADTNPNPSPSPNSNPGPAKAPSGNGVAQASSNPATPVAQKKVPRSPKPGGTNAPLATAPDPALVAQGQALFSSYQCDGCHGESGEGSNMAPPLAGLAMPWTAAQIVAFIGNPDASATGLGMPAIPATSPDNQALVAFIRSLPAATKAAPSAPQPPAPP